ncbi:hypothetical protein [Rubellimicrobium roseum]|uniref:hypothetical protein n=1 Tax=Rubellimicrobium roseum TaxID=687525 RepID=UPI00159BB162|nr:hypothetical protein [Rubellimicrobium roseum]
MSWRGARPGDGRRCDSGAGHQSPSEEASPADIDEFAALHGGLLPSVFFEPIVGDAMACTKSGPNLSAAQKAIDRIEEFGLFGFPNG